MNHMSYRSHTTNLCSSEGVIEIMNESNIEQSSLFLEIDVQEDNTFSFTSSIDMAIAFAESELVVLEETVDSVNALKPQCDKVDYILAASAGTLCGIIDIFLVGKPGESSAGDSADKWFAERTKDFAKICGWDNQKDDSLKAAIRHLEGKFKVPYDQTVGQGIFKELIELTPDNHHLKSLGHNPTILGLFFSILNQFTNTSTFVSNGELITLKNSEGKFELQGNSVPSKLFCGFVNWFGHIVSDMSGSRNSKGRGMGIPSPIWSWINDVIAIKRTLGIETSELDRSMNELALQIFEEGYDLRFQTAQLIPVLINELIVRLFYCVRRALNYYSKTQREARSFKTMWTACEPFSNPTVKRMLTIAHGTFCLVDVGDAAIRAFITGGGNFNAKEFFLRLNIPGVGRFAISLYGEARRGVEVLKASQDAAFAKREKIIVEDYLSGLRQIASIYDDKELLKFTEDFQNSDCYLQAFEKTVMLAEKRSVSESEILRTKSDIDDYFMKEEN